MTDAGNILGVMLIANHKSLAASVRRIIYVYNAWKLSRRGVEAGPRITLQGKVLIYLHPESRMQLGSRIVLNAKAAKNTLEARGPIVLRTFRRNAKILIGNDSGLTSCTIAAGSSVKIGERVLIGGGVVITDSDHHVVDMPTGRRFAGLPPKAADRPVIIGDDVFIGARSIILKGVEIGNGTVIGAGSVVSASIPAGVVAVGNPCRVVRALRSDAAVVD